MSLKNAKITLDRFFQLSENDTNIRREIIAGLITFLTMAYIIFVQPAILSGAMFNMNTGLDFGAVTTATCISAALATAIMGLYARYPIAQAPGMGENFFFVFSAIPAATAAGFANAWEVALGVVFISGVLFLILSVSGIRKIIIDSISPSMKNGIAVGIGLFIAFIGLQNTGLIMKDAGTAVKLNTQFESPDLIVFFFGLLLTAALYARRIGGAILWGIVGAALLAIVLQFILLNLPPSLSDSKLVSESMLITRFKIAQGIFSSPPSLSPTFLKMDIIHALSFSMFPFIVIFLFMNVFDTIGTLIGVGEQAGLIKDDKLPRANQALLSDAVGTTVGACLGTSTVVSFIESAAGVEYGGRTGLTALTTALLFLLAPFFSPLIAMVGSYTPITAPALVIVGSMMIRNVTKVEWSDYSEAIPAFLTIIGIPLTYSISDGLALGFISYPIIKLLSGRGKEVRWLMYVLAFILIGYFVFVRSGT
ncbi:MAG TPA: NCS2 family permease [Thermodesulfobacteriota bacterium]|nr:NCS2 family permease [Thermodesulfobacteriota bacterium]